VPRLSASARKDTYSGTYSTYLILIRIARSTTVDSRKMRVLISRRQQQITPSIYSLPLLLVCSLVVHPPPCRPRATKLRTTCKIAFVRKRRPLSVPSGRYGLPKGVWMQGACVYVCVHVRFCIRPLNDNCLRKEERRKSAHSFRERGPFARRKPLRV